MRADPFVKEIRLGDNECCSPGSANGDCKESYKGAVDILGCFERLTQVSQGEFGTQIVNSAARWAGIPKHGPRVYISKSYESFRVATED